MYETWQACDTAIRAHVPDMAVGVGDTGEAPLPATHVLLSAKMKKWAKESTNLFYAFHW
jgi:hypothetical protein